ncbi:methyltransferase domain-containing protein [Saccharothrix deserti]|uniref:methyltransferase domain-containing protein n=1 Tax=Saccharothrix deserti TaxID=2593674 RepID=UPI00131B00C2|nr:methyltransferase domain-containing protein [Saccharothrix deserti]
MTAARLVARTVRGVEDVVAAEIRHLGLGRVERVGHREVWFRCADPSPDVLALRTADDVFLVAAEVTGVGRAKADLRLLADAAVPISRLLELRERCGGVVTTAGVDVSASFLGRRNYTRYDVEDAVGTALAAALAVPYRTRRAGGVPPPGGLSWRVTIADDRALLALRIADRPLHRRSYRVRSRPGSLHPPLAAAMVRLAGPVAGATVLDPFCGTGTIPIEAALAASRVVHSLRIVAGDRDPTALASAVTNTEQAAGTGPSATRLGDHHRNMYGNTVLVPRLERGAPNHPGTPRITWTTADAGRLPIADDTIDLVLTNPPWARQVPPTGTLAREPGRFWRELRRVLRPDGRALLLLPDADERVADAARAGLAVRSRRPVSLSGLHPEIVELTPR